MRDLGWEAGLSSDLAWVGVTWGHECPNSSYSTIPSASLKSRTHAKGSSLQRPFCRARLWCQTDPPTHSEGRGSMGLPL